MLGVGDKAELRAEYLTASLLGGCRCGRLQTFRGMARSRGANGEPVALPLVKRPRRLKEAYWEPHRGYRFVLIPVHLTLEDDPQLPILSLSEA